MLRLLSAVLWLLWISIYVYVAFSFTVKLSNGFKYSHCTWHDKVLECEFKIKP